MPLKTIQGFVGISRTSLNAELEKSPSNSLYVGDNIFVSPSGDIYVQNGYSSILAGGNADIGNGGLDYIYYSATLDLVLVFSYDGTGWDFWKVNVDTGIATLIANHPFTGNYINIADWPTTSKVYITDGVTYQSYNGTTLTDLSGTAPLGIGEILHVHKNHMFVSSGNTIHISSPNDPETFDSADNVTILEGGPRICALSTMNGNCRVHKLKSIIEISGNDFTTTGLKDISINDLSVGRGAGDVFAIYSYNGDEYAICKDGFWKFTDRGQSKLSDSISGILQDHWGAPIRKYENYAGGRKIYNCTICEYSPLSGADFGNHYIIFMYNDNQTGQNWIWFFDTARNFFTRYASMPFSISGITYDLKRNQTYLCGLTRIYCLDNVETRDGTAITGNAVLNPEDFGTRVVTKMQDLIYILNHPMTGLSVYIGIDGLYPLFNLTSYLNDRDGNLTDTVQAPRREISGVFSQYRFTRSGGGNLLLSGLVANDLEKNLRPGRTLKVSRKVAVEDAARTTVDGASVTPYLPVKFGNTTSVNAQTVYVVTHGLGETPEAVFVSIVGLTISSAILISGINDTTFTFTLPANPGNGKVINWLAIAPGTRLNDAYFRGKREFLTTTTTKKHYHNMEATPDCILVGKQDAATQGVFISNKDKRSLSLDPDATNTGQYLLMCCFTNGTIDQYWKCGYSNTTSNQAILHGFPTATRAFVWPDKKLIPSHKLTSLSSTTLTVESTDPFYWLVAP